MLDIIWVRYDADLQLTELLAIRLKINPIMLVMTDGIFELFQIRSVRNSIWNCWICSSQWYPLETQKSTRTIVPSKTAPDVILPWKVIKKVSFTIDLDRNAAWWWTNQIAAKNSWSATFSLSVSLASAAVIKKISMVRALEIHESPYKY